MNPGAEEACFETKSQLVFAIIKTRKIEATLFEMRLGRKASLVSQIEFIAANPLEHRRELLELNLEYMDWVCNGVQSHFGIPHEKILGMPVADYVPTVIEKVCGDPPPRGVFYIVKVDGALAGMGGIRHVRDGYAEIKRIYFRPLYRGKQLGEIMLNRLLSDASTFGYKSALLDSGPFMTTAHKVYERCGFVDCAPYAEAEVPAEFHCGWRFMQRSL